MFRPREYSASPVRLATVRRAAAAAPRPSRRRFLDPRAGGLSAPIG
jgi:hypothetical protein